MGPPALEASAVWVRFGASEILRAADLRVGQGEIVAVVGPSGSGKSTLLLLLCGILEPQAGEVRIDGHSLFQLRRRQRDRIRRSCFGFVFQSGDLVPELTMVENVCLPMRLNGHPYGESRRRAIDQMGRLGVRSLAERYSYEVSGGELQRVAIARALVHRPPVVLADEPTGALDEDNAQLTFELLVEHARLQRAAVVVVTHARRLASQADRTLSLHDGQLLGDNP